MFSGLLKLLREAAGRLRGHPPQSPSALGMIAFQSGDLARAAKWFEQSLRRDPGDAAVHFMLGNVRIAQNQPQAAIASYRSALAHRADFPEACSNLGNALKDQGRLPEAVELYEKAVRLRPAFAEAQYNLGLAYQQLGQNDRALACFAAAVAVRPDFAEAQYSLGYLLANEDRRAEALACFRNALSLMPEHAEARWGQAMMQLLAVCGPGDDPGRGRAEFAAALAELDRWFDSSRAQLGARAVGSFQPFRLAYHEENNRDLLARYGGLCARLMRDGIQGELPRSPASRPHRSAVTVAVVSRYLSNHSVWNALTKGWFQQLDRSMISLRAFCTGPEDDAQTRIARSCADHFEQGQRPLRAWADAIAAHRPDVILFPEIGMDAMTMRIASLRLAPVQAVAWGHPETTGLPTIDYYLSAADFEPPDAQDYYTERLVRLPGFGCHFEPAEGAAVPPDLGQLGIDADAPLLICPGTPFKYAPEHDPLLAQIAARLPRCQLVFFVHALRGLSERLRQRLAAEFRRNALDPDAHLKFLPWQSTAAFRGLMQRADLCLDTIGFSGFNTAMLAIECGLPVVTREGRFMRGRFASAILKRVGAPELVAATAQDYVSTAVGLIENGSLRARLRERIAANRAPLFGDATPIRALERFLGQARANAIPPAT